SAYSTRGARDVCDGRKRSCRIQHHRPRWDAARGRPEFYDASEQTQEPPTEVALVLVGETLHSYDKIASDMFRRNFFDQLLLVAAAGGLTWFGMNRGLLPLRRLSKSLVDR